VNRTAGIPFAYNLGALYQYVICQPPTVSHRALADVKATIAVLFHQIFWENRSKFIFTFGRPEEEEADYVMPAAQQQRSLLEDSDTSISSQDSATTVDDNTGKQQTMRTMPVQLETSGRKILSSVHRAHFRPNFLRNTSRCPVVVGVNEQAFNAAHSM
jgi:hypothetical protein